MHIASMLNYSLYNVLNFKFKMYALKYFLQKEEFYVCIYSHRYGDTVLFHHEGGIDIGDVDSKVRG